MPSRLRDMSGHRRKAFLLLPRTKSFQVVAALAAATNKPRGDSPLGYSIPVPVKTHPHSTLKLKLQTSKPPNLPATKVTSLYNQQPIITPSQFVTQIEHSPPKNLWPLFANYDQSIKSGWSLGKLVLFCERQMHNQQ